MDTSFGDKSKCEANKDISSVNSTYGFSVGAFFVFGARVSVTIDLKKWNDELTEIFEYSLNYGTR